MEFGIPLIKTGKDKFLMSVYVSISKELIITSAIGHDRLTGTRLILISQIKHEQHRYSDAFQILATITKRTKTNDVSDTLLPRESFKAAV